MTAAYRLKGLGWMTSSVAIALGFYLVSLQVAAERKRVEAVTARIAVAKRDIRALETEFETRANLTQLEQWNGDTLALAAPVAGQFVRNARELASLDPSRGTSLQTAALVVPMAVPVEAKPTSAAAPVAVANASVRGSDRLATLITKVAITPASVVRAVADDGAPTPRRTSSRVQAVALLDDDFLSQATRGAILSGAQAERKRGSQ